MADGFQQLIAHLRGRVPDALGEARAEWGVRRHGEGARRLIRADIIANLKSFDLPKADLDQIENLKTPPRPANWSLSVSHTLDLGGWLATPRPLSVGFDIEDTRRLQSRLIERICTAEEVAAAPDPLLLWSAKEASYKCLETGQPQVITDLTLRSWKADGPGFGFEAAYATCRIDGFAIRREDLSFAYALFSI
jgi:4'-phosphopantetheinyl transferase EntD